MMSVCRNNSVNSFFGLPPPPPPLEEDHFSQAFHQTLGVSPPPPLQTPLILNLSLTFNNYPLKPIKPLTVSPADSAAGDLAGDKRNPAHIDLMSCTESLGFESSDDMSSSFDDLGCRSRSRSRSSNNDELESSSSSAEEVAVGCFSRRREKGVVAKRWEERRFPPPLTSLSENGRRNFTLKSVRRDGRLEIVGVMIQHPEILCATRDNGRLRMHLVKTAVVSDDDDDDEEETEERENEEEIELSEEEEEEEEEEAAVTAEEEEEEEEEEEREWRRMPAAAGIRRCYHQRQMHVWGPQQHRFVTTI